MKSPFTREQREQIRGETFYRKLAIDSREADSESRTVPASMSSETPVKRWFGNEILLHGAENVNLDRAVGGKLPMLFGHDTDVMIGAGEGFALNDKRLSGTLRFAQATRAPEVWEQVKEGMPLGISIGYRIDEWKESADSDDVTVTRWTLHEVSVVTVPADHTVGINRSLQEDIPMAEETNTQTTVKPEDVATNSSATVRLVHEKGKAEGIEAERARIADIRNLFVLPGFQSEAYLELRDNAIDGGMSVNDTRAAILQLAGSGVTPVATSAAQRFTPNLIGPNATAAGATPRQGLPVTQMGRDEREGFFDAASRAIGVKAGLITDKEEMRKAREGNECYGLTMTELARESLRRQGIDTRGYDAMGVVGLAFTNSQSFMRSTIGHGVGDFANVLLDAANKSLLVGWEENEETFQAWTRSMSLSDFKTHNLVNLSNFGDLDVVPEYAEYKYGTFSDVKETIALRTYGKLFSITRQAIINDDLSVFTSIPNKMGRAAARMVGDEAYSVLTLNAALNQDATALFDVSTHANYITSGAAPSVSTVNVGFTSMATKTDPGGTTLNIVPRYLIVPRALETTSRVLVAAQYDPAGSAGTLPPNPFQGRLEVVADARLDAFNSAGWFLAASPMSVGTVVVGYLNGQQTPYLEQETAFTQDGVSMKVRLDCRAAAEDYRGLFYNDGA